MAKGKSFFGLKRGSTKSLTFQVLNGAQIVKDRVFEVKNPRTNSQMIQRMCIATATAAYTHMKEICDHSFEGVSYGQRSMAEFISLNVRELLADVKGAGNLFSYNPYQDRNLYASPFILSRGSLKFPTSGLVFTQENGFVTIELPYPEGITDESRTPDFFDALRMRLGDLLTFPFIYQGTSANDWRFGWLRLRYAHEANMEVGEAEWADCFDFETNLVFNSSYSQNSSVKFIVELPAPMGDYVFGTAILSRHSNNKWQRSNAAIQIGSPAWNNPTPATALATYPTGADYVLNGANIGGSDSALNSFHFDDFTVIENLQGEHLLAVKSHGNIIPIGTDEGKGILVESYTDGLILLRFNAESFFENDNCKGTGGDWFSGEFLSDYCALTDNSVDSNYYVSLEEIRSCSEENDNCGTVSLAIYNSIEGERQYFYNWYLEYDGRDLSFKLVKD